MTPPPRCFWLALVPLATACIPKSGPATPTAAAEGSPVPGSGEALPATPGRNVPWIKVNTVGYPSDWKKVVVFNQEPQSATVVDEDERIVLHIDPSKIRHHGVDEASQDEVWQADISELVTPGAYVVTSGDVRSDKFVVGDSPYRKVLIAAQKMFYFQRSRTALEAPYATWEGRTFARRGVPHVHEDVGWDIQSYPEKTRRLQPVAGWHDAGNFDMYVPSTGPSAQGLLLAYEAHPELFRDGDLSIPESGNEIPDLLDEAKWGIDWVLSMQAPDGGFHLRETTITQSETSEGPAHLDRSTRWIDRVGSASTAKGCALSALAARVYAPFDSEYAELNRERARRAWTWLQAHPERLLVPPVGAAVNNEYLLWDDGKEVPSDLGARFIAAGELWATFREATALEFMQSVLDQPQLQPSNFVSGGWTNMSRWGLQRLAQDDSTPVELRAEAKARLLAAAALPLQQSERDGYLCATEPEDYYWGSNSNLMEKAHLMLVAAELDPDDSERMTAAAREQWHWVLGRNPNGYSMVTQIGKAPKAMYHLEWGPLSPQLPPGYLLGGPNHQTMPFLAPDAPAKALLWEATTNLRSGVVKGGMWHWAQSDLWDAGFVPENQWTDGWWAVTEPDIYYNMNLVLAAASLLDHSQRPEPD